MHIKCRYFSQKNLATGGWNHPKDAITIMSVLAQPLNLEK